MSCPLFFVRQFINGQRSLRLKSLPIEMRSVGNILCNYERRNFSSRPSTAVPSWATLDPNSLGVVSELHDVQNLVKGNWDGDTKNKIEIPNPMNKDAPNICTIPDTAIEELEPFVTSMKAVSKSGMHNPLKNVERYLMYGEISRMVSDSKFIELHH